MPRVRSIRRDSSGNEKCGVSWGWVGVGRIVRVLWALDWVSGKSGGEGGGGGDTSMESAEYEE